jgi:hypothetical protein
MVLALSNRTPYGCEQLPLTARNGATILRIVVKAGYRYSSDRGLDLLDKQPAPQLSDEYWEHDPISAEAVRIESDVSLYKPHTDLIVNGHAIAVGRKAVTGCEASVAYQGRILRRLKVLGDRVWRRSIRGWSLSDPLRFETMPITYARAYGGKDAAGAEARNLIGTGYATQPGADFEGMRAPNIEDPAQLIQQPSDRPTPAGLGVVSRASSWRARYAGTYDAKWLDEGYPLLPKDFDDRFNQAVESQQWIARPRGGESIQITGMSDRGAINIKLPPCQLRVGLHYRDRRSDQPLDLDSVCVDTDLHTLTLTWRGTADIHGDPFRLIETVIHPSDVSATPPKGCCC